MNNDHNNKDISLTSLDNIYELDESDPLKVRLIELHKQEERAIIKEIQNTYNKCKNDTTKCNEFLELADQYITRFMSSFDKKRKFYYLPKFQKLLNRPS